MKNTLVIKAQRQNVKLDEVAFEAPPQAIIIRARAEGQKAETADETKTVVRAVTYCTGQASAMGNFDSDLKNAPRESKDGALAPGAGALDPRCRLAGR